MALTSITPPDEAVRNALVAESSFSLVAEGTAGQNCFLGPERPAGPGVPVNCVFVSLYGGVRPIPYMNQPNKKSIWRDKVQVVVRREAISRPTGQTLARDIQFLLHTATISGYVSCVALESAPILLGKDSAGLWRWSMNFELVRKE